MRRSLSVEWGNTKKGTGESEGVRKGENTCAKQKYTPVFSRARGVYSVTLFFLILIGFKEFKLI
jgi:hypothetical protein